jgi:protein associated with RNAse G/E
MTVQVYKKDTIPHYNWETVKIFEEGKGIICYKKGPRTLNHQTRGKIFTFPTDVIEYYWYETPFSLHVSLDQEKKVLHYYSNIHSLPIFDHGDISFIDYDLDVIREDISPAYIVDQEDFERHRILYNYSEEIQKEVPMLADKIVTLLNEDSLFQKKNQLDAFKRIEAGERDFLSQWTSLSMNFKESGALC